MQNKTNLPYQETGNSSNDMYNYGFRIDLHKNTDWFFPVKPHYHQYVEMLYFRKGQAKIMLNDKFLTFKAGDLAYIGRSIIHTINNNSNEDLEYYLLQINWDLLFNNASSFLDSNALDNIKAANIACLWKSSEINSKNIFALSEECYAECTSRSYGFNHIVKFNLYKIFTEILRALYLKEGIDVFEQNDSRQKAFINLVDDHISSSYKDKLTAKEMATRCNMSYSYFSRNFKASAGQPFVNT